MPKTERDIVTRRDPNFNPNVQELPNDLAV